MEKKRKEKSAKIKFILYRGKNTKDDNNNDRNYGGGVRGRQGRLVKCIKIACQT